MLNRIRKKFMKNLRFKYCIILEFCKLLTMFFTTFN